MNGFILTGGDIKDIILAIGVVVSAVYAGIAAVRSKATHQAVNSRMDEFKKLFEEKFKMEGGIEARAARAEADAARLPSARQTDTHAPVALGPAPEPLKQKPVPVEIVNTPLTVTETPKKPTPK